MPIEATLIEMTEPIENSVCDLYRHVLLGDLRRIRDGLANAIAEGDLKADSYGKQLVDRFQEHIERLEKLAGWGIAAEYVVGIIFEAIDDEDVRDGIFSVVREPEYVARR